ncbi:nucleotide kinase domain-containing protein, partial [Staphylococcus aureus]|uniref:nucleotide kinase domain-containing protein n=1 Tax=Staphylococcus aureus TaxID=1280 RepID=UPI00158182D4
MTTPRINDIAAFMKARHDIYLDRKAGKPGPWTADPVLRDGRFCNIFRELDTVTIWVEENIRKPYADHPNLWFMLAIARYINWPDTLRYLMDEAEPGTWPDGEDFEPAKLTKALEDYAAAGNKVYTGAYMIRAESDPSKEWYSWTKHRYIAEIVLGRLWEDREEWARDLEPAKSGLPKVPRVPTLESVWAKFQQHRYIGWGPFMAYEVVTDLRHTRYLRNAQDIWTWANAGPGAIRGLNRLYGRDLAAKPRPEQTNAEMIELMRELNALDARGFNETFGPPQLGSPHVGPRFEARDIEHTLCEFDKYERVRLNEGKMRSKYDWRKATTL